MTEDLQNIANKYRSLGIIKGAEFLLPPEIMVEFIGELAKAGVLIYGCDLWRYVDPTKDLERIVELLGAGIDVSKGHEKMPSVERSAETVRDFIKYQLPDDAELVSLVTEDYEVNRLIRLEERNDLS